MKPTIYRRLACCGLALLAPLAALAADGAIDVSGIITNTTCSINIDGSGKMTTTVPLPTVSTGRLRNAGDVDGEVQFNLQTTCLQPLQLTSSTIYWEPNGALVDLTTGNLRNQASDGAGNVQVQLLSGGTPIAINRGPGQQNSPVATGLTPGHYYQITWPFSARYYATGPATPGAVISDVTFTVVYS